MNNYADTVLQMVSGLRNRELFDLSLPLIVPKAYAVSLCCGIREWIICGSFRPKRSQITWFVLWIWCCHMCMFVNNEFAGNKFFRYIVSIGGQITPKTFWKCIKSWQFVIISYFFYLKMTWRNYAKLVSCAVILQSGIVIQFVPTILPGCFTNKNKHLITALFYLNFKDLNVIFIYFRE